MPIKAIRDGGLFAGAASDRGSVWTLYFHRNGCGFSIRKSGERCLRSPQCCDLPFPFPFLLITQNLLNLREAQPTGQGGLLLEPADNMPAKQSAIIPLQLRQR